MEGGQIDSQRQTVKHTFTQRLEKHIVRLSNKYSQEITDKVRLFNKNSQRQPIYQKELKRQSDDI